MASWSFSLGMLVFAIESICGCVLIGSTSADAVRRWETIDLFVRSFMPGGWLTFSLVFSRGNQREFLARSRVLLVAVYLLPVVAAFALRGPAVEVEPVVESPSELWIGFGSVASILNGCFLVSSVAILMNVEKTFRAAVGTMQWRIKFLTLGLAVIFGATIYTRSQTLLFSGHQVPLLNVEAAALLIGCSLIALGYFRSGFGEIDVYPSRTVLHTSLTVLLAGGYLFVVGVLAEVVARYGGAGSFRLQSVFVLVAVSLLGVLLLSDRLRQKTQNFISRHFRRPQHDFRRIWGLFTDTIASAVDDRGICAASARSLSSTFNALSVSFWLFDDRHERLVLAASTAQSERAGSLAETSIPIASMENPPLPLLRPFDLERSREPWGDSLRSATAGEFKQGGHRLCVPLVAREHWLGVAILADRVSGIPYTTEELDLLQCIGDQVATALLNAKLTGEIMRGRELEVFRTMSAFFVHDLKNVASTLTLMLQNLPRHFDSAEFREDALRGIGKTVARMNELIRRLGALRDKLEINTSPLNLNDVVEETLATTVLPPTVRVRRQAEPLSSVVGDREQLQSVITNLLLNAADAAGAEGELSVETTARDGWATISVRDNGCGMSADFMRDSLFRPFQSTKKNGLGIGMFQSRMIVEAHHGSIQVTSELGAGTTFRVLLPTEPSRK
ncbi:MAG: PEP-CTERM system histidine kinase PrsK [Chthoniobacterales bacterium]|nr:PEP-CTERM system histidine kinase PrsK [Chthoniobacterales bacterium]